MNCSHLVHELLRTGLWLATKLLFITFHSFLMTCFNQFYFNFVISLKTHWLYRLTDWQITNTLLCLVLYDLVQGIRDERYGVLGYEAVWGMTRSKVFPHMWCQKDHFFTISKLRNKYPTIFWDGWTVGIWNISTNELVFPEKQLFCFINLEKIIMNGKKT